MLQQTQVTTVVGYFERFMRTFPSVAELAAADVDQVLHLWSGLGYYARARNLHKTAKVVTHQHGGVFPTTLAGLQALPGIGASTAGAILSLAMGVRQPILDGNVKRVLSRYHGIEQWSGRSATLKQLWELAELHTPQTRVADYTQAIMDLGATVCVRSRPQCGICPLAVDCVAKAADKQHLIPAPKPKLDRPRRSTIFVIVRDGDGRFLLQRRPPSGIWGGLWGFPECAPEEDPARWCQHQLGIRVHGATTLGVVHHSFTHYDLDIQPVLMESVGDAAERVMEARDCLWYNAEAPAQSVGLAAPVTALLNQLQGLYDNECQEQSTA